MCVCVCVYMCVCVCVCVCVQHPDSEQQVRDGMRAAEELLLSRPTHTGEYRLLVPLKQVLHMFILPLK